MATKSTKAKASADWTPTPHEKAAITTSRDKAHADQAALEQHMSSEPDLPAPSFIEGTWQRGDTRFSALDLIAARVEHGEDGSVGRWGTLRNALRRKAEASAKAVLPDRPELAVAARDALAQHVRYPVEARMIAPTPEPSEDGKATLTIVQRGMHGMREYGAVSGELDFAYVRDVDRVKLNAETIADLLVDQGWSITSGSGGTSKLDDDHELDTFSLDVALAWPRTPLIATMPDDAKLAEMIGAALRGASYRHARTLANVHGAPTRIHEMDDEYVPMISHEIDGDTRTTSAVVVVLIKCPRGSVPLYRESFGSYVADMIGHHAAGRIVNAELLAANDVSGTYEEVIRCRLRAELVSRVPS